MPDRDQPITDHSPEAVRALAMTRRGVDPIVIASEYGITERFTLEQAKRAMELGDTRITMAMLLMYGVLVPPVHKVDVNHRGRVDINNVVTLSDDELIGIVNRGRQPACLPQPIVRAKGKGNGNGRGRGKRPAPQLIVRAGLTSGRGS